MIKTIIVLFCAFYIAGCCNKPSTEVKETKAVTQEKVLTETKEIKQEEKQEVKKEEVKKEVVENESENAKKWLIASINAYLKDKMESFEKLTTKTYAEYKTDAINIDFDGGLTIEQFNKKWKDKFDVKFAGTGVGFIIAAQDWSDKTAITKFDFIEKSADGAYWFNVIVSDVPNKLEYKRDIKVIKEGDSFLISDIKEYN